MLKKFQNHINTHFSFLKDKKSLLAVSGGLDSMVLAHLFFKSNLKFSIAHCNFQLREKESDEDERFVKDFCQAHDIEGFFQKFDTQKSAQDTKSSIQLTARKLRYDWFYELLKKEGFDFILTAHHLDDDIETFLINFIRGTGLEGLTGIPQQHEKVLRPLLIFSREEIEKYAWENNVPWREDSSNISDKYMRNKIRHQVVPVLKDLNPGFLQSFQKTQKHLKQSQSLAEDASHIVYKKVITEDTHQKKINLRELLQQKNYEAYLYDWLSHFGFTAWDDIYGLVHAQSGKIIYSENFRLFKDRDTLILEPKPEITEEVFFIEESQENIQNPLILKFEKVTEITETGLNLIYVDRDTLKFPLKLRRWQEGDYFYPFGMDSRKKLSKFFKDEKLSLSEKENIWLLCFDNQIVWIVGKRPDNRFRVSGSTKNITKITLL